MLLHFPTDGFLVTRESSLALRRLKKKKMKRKERNDTRTSLCERVENASDVVADNNNVRNVATFEKVNK